MLPYNVIPMLVVKHTPWLAARGSSAAAGPHFALFLGLRSLFSLFARVITGGEGCQWIEVCDDDDDDDAAAAAAAAAAAYTSLTLLYVSNSATVSFLSGLLASTLATRPLYLQYNPNLTHKISINVRGGTRTARPCRPQLRRHRCHWVQLFQPEAEVGR